jgi:hypothetical protein
MMNKKKMTATEAVAQATTKLSEDITQLTAKRDASLSIFRQTAQNLGAINQDLQKSIDNMSELETFLAEQKIAASKVISDNAHVMDKIYDIIGK